MLDTPEHIGHFLTLQRKNEDELKTICSEMGLTPEGSKQALIKKLLTLSIEGKIDFMVPQALALRSRIEGQEIEGSADVLRKIRALLFKGKRKEFTLLNTRKVGYKTPLIYAECKKEMLKTLLEKNMFLIQPYQRELMGTIKTSPERFSLHFISKPSNDGKSFVMLHVEPKGI